MMKKLTLTLFVAYSVLLLGVGLFAWGCEPGGFLIIENQRNEDIRIYVTLILADGTSIDPPGKETDYGIVLAQTTKELASISFARRYWVHRIQAKDLSGRVVFSRGYNLDDLERIDWKIVIAPSSD